MVGRLPQSSSGVLGALLFFASLCGVLQLQCLCCLLIWRRLRAVDGKEMKEGLLPLSSRSDADGWTLSWTSFPLATDADPKETSDPRRASVLAREQRSPLPRSTSPLTGQSLTAAPRPISQQGAISATLSASAVVAKAAEGAAAAHATAALPTATPVAGQPAGPAVVTPPPPPPPPLASLVSPEPREFERYEEEVMIDENDLARALAEERSAYEQKSDGSARRRRLSSPEEGGWWYAEPGPASTASSISDDATGGPERYGPSERSAPTYVRAVLRADHLRTRRAVKLAGRRASMMEQMRPRLPIDGREWQYVDMYDASAASTSTSTPRSEQQPTPRAEQTWLL